MKILINSRHGMPQLKEGLEAGGHAVGENIWEFRKIAAEFDAVFVEFRTIFNRKWRFVPLALRLRSAGIPVATWNLDAPWHMNRSQRRVNLLLKSGMLSVYATHSMQDAPAAGRMRVLHLPNAAWTGVYNLHGATLDELMHKNDFAYDVSFIGNMDASFREHRRRIAFLEELGAALDKKKIRHKFFESFGLKAGEQVRIIQNSRINLSCLSAADSTGVPSWGLTERCYGIPACGGFLLAEERVHMKDDFDLRTEVATYADFDDCLRKIDHYLTHDDERRQIMARAHKRVLRDHTYRHRADRLVAEIQKCMTAA